MCITCSWPSCYYAYVYMYEFAMLAGELLEKDKHIEDV